MQWAVFISSYAVAVVLVAAYPTDEIVFRDESNEKPSMTVASMTRNTFEDEDDGNSTDITEEEEEEVDQELTDQLKEFGISLFGEPKNESGDAVRNWDPKSGIKPEELGGYVQGDMLIPRAMVGDRNGITLKSARWPRGRIPYTLSPLFDQRERSLIAQAMGEFHRRTCIRWVPRRRERNYVYIDNQDTGCWSTVGRDLMDRNELNLQSGNPGCLMDKGTAIHELMHTVGFFHEQSRWERDNYVTIMYENMEPDERQQFMKHSRKEADGQGVPYDYASIMHYSAKAFTKNGKPTIVPKQRGVKIGQHDTLSPGDVKKINRMYKCNVN